MFGLKKTKSAGRKRTSDIDVIIAKCVNEIWIQYDDDNSGFLDKEETRTFMTNILSDMGNGSDKMSDH